MNIDKIKNEISVLQEKACESEGNLFCVYYYCIIQIINLSLNISNNKQKQIFIEKIKNCLTILNEDERLYSKIYNYLHIIFNNCNNFYQEETLNISMKINNKKKIVKILEDYEYPFDLKCYSYNGKEINIKSLRMNSKNISKFKIFEYKYGEEIIFGAYNKVYKFPDEKKILRITYINEKRKTDEEKLRAIKNELNSIYYQHYLSKKYNNDVALIYDYGFTIIDENNLFECYSIMEKGIIDLFDFWVNCVDNNNTIKNNYISYFVLFLCIIIILIQKIKNIHNEDILHLDIKFENVILINGTNKNYDIKISQKMNEDLKLGLEFEGYFKYILIKYIDFGFLLKKKNNVFRNNFFKGTPEYQYINLRDKKYYYSKYTDLFAISRLLLQLIVLHLNYNENKNNSLMSYKQEIFGKFRLINDKDINDLKGKMKLSNNKSNNFKNLIKSILPDENNYITCLINGEYNTKKKRPEIYEDCDDKYLEKMHEFLGLIDQDELHKQIFNNKIYKQ